MFIEFIWKVEIYLEAALVVRNDMWKFIKTIYIQNFNVKNYQYFLLFGIEEILDLVVNKFSFSNLFRKD